MSILLSFPGCASGKETMQETSKKQGQKKDKSRNEQNKKIRAEMNKIENRKIIEKDQ